MELLQKYFRFHLIALLIIVFSSYLHGEANIKFKKGTVKIKNKKISIEIAKTPEEHAYGLMYRNSIPKNFGMLFIFEDEDYRSFWMKNTFIDLSIAFINKKKVIVDIQEMKKVSSSTDLKIPSCQSKQPAQYVLEMNKGWFKQNKIKVGERLSDLKMDQDK